MRCHECHRNIAAGVEAQKMVVEYLQADGTVRLHGYGMPDGPIGTASGQMVTGRHSKCFWIAKKREAKGDEVTGRVVSGTPTAYDISEMVLNRDEAAALGLTPDQARERSTVQLSRRLDGIRAIADRLGKGVGDPTVQEAYLAEQHGGPYPHEHHHRLDTYQLLAHLRYAHGVDEPASDAHLLHLALHYQKQE